MQTPPELEDIRLHTCSKTWGSLESSGAEGDARIGEKTRYCGDCALHVHDLAAYTRDEVRELLDGRQGRLCLMKTVLPNGTLLTRRDVAASETVARPWLARLAGSAASLLALLVGTSLVACARQEPGAGAAEPSAEPNAAGDELPELSAEELEMMRALGGYCD